MMSGDDALIDHLAQGLCPEDKCTSTNIGYGKAQLSHAGVALGSVQPAPSSGGAALDHDGPLASSGGSAATNKNKGITRLKYNKFSHRKEGDLENVGPSLSKKLVGQEHRIKHIET